MLLWGRGPGDATEEPGQKAAGEGGEGGGGEAAEKEAEEEEGGGRKVLRQRRRWEKRQKPCKQYLRSKFTNHH